MPTPPSPSPGVDPSRWDPKVIGMVGLICSIFLLFSYYKILDRNCAMFRSRNPDQRRRLNEHLDEYSFQFRSRGLDSYVMHSLPITRIEKSKDGELQGNNSSECAVCLGEFEEGNGCHVCDVNASRDSSMAVHSFPESLNREDFRRERSERYQVVRFEVVQNTSVRTVAESNS
ncbi:hypothetical protein DH2020_006974 [Rehmannia glutinosa]|uniref:RING-type E3 ubiquitin transferase n=1 Tax=Rehmannia glutinosa TaxID=99300 RepID=A0ABR0W5W6_REHGL